MKQLLASAVKSLRDTTNSFDEGTRVADKGQTIEGVAETMATMTDESDEILKNMKRMEAETKAMTEIAKAEQAQMEKR